MAYSSAPFALKNLPAGLDAEQLRQAVSSLVINGGGLLQAGDLAVTQTTTPSLAVSVGAGRVWVPGTNVANVAGQGYSTQGMYFLVNDGPYTVPLDTADSANPRIDVIYVGAVDTQYGGASDTVKIDKVKGTPAVTPVAPALPANAVALAQVTVPANASSVSNSNIATRNPAVVGLSVAAPTATVTGTGGWNLTGNLQREAAQVRGNFMCGYGSSAGAFTVGTGFIQALTLSNPGFTPVRDVFGFTTILSSANVVRLDCAFNINPSGQLWIRGLNASYTVQPNDKFYIASIWDAS